MGSAGPAADTMPLWCLRPRGPRWSRPCASPGAWGTPWPCWSAIRGQAPVHGVAVGV